VNTHYENEMLVAVYNIDIARVRDLLAEDPALADAISLGDPAICKAAFLGSEEMVQLLVEHRADLGAVDEDGCTCLYNAIMSHNDDLVDYLLAQGVEIDEQSAPSLALRERQATNECKQDGSAPKRSSGCYIATACYGSYDHPDVRALRRFRDERLLLSATGRWIVSIYYTVSPRVAARIGENAWLSRTIRRRLLEPLVRKLGDWQPEV